jgi:hypothetical protein
MPTLEQIQMSSAQCPLAPRSSVATAPLRPSSSSAWISTKSSCARHVKSKLSKSFETWFFPVGDDVLRPWSAVRACFLIAFIARVELDERRTGAYGNSDTERLLRNLFP